MNDFSPVYGAVRSWRYGNSLGIDPIGEISTCSFNCVYCQLGAIEQLSLERQVFIPTEIILQLIEQRKLEFAIDVITVSGSGEPTLALNLGAIIAGIKSITPIPIIVLTNGSLLGWTEVCQDLSLADEVSVKLDGIMPERVQKVNRPALEWSVENLMSNLQQFRHQFTGKLTIQTMIISEWSAVEEQLYIDHMKALRPDRIYLNSPRRPKPKARLLQGRENLTALDRASWFQPVRANYLSLFAQKITQITGISVSHVLEHKS